MQETGKHARAAIAGANCDVERPGRRVSAVLLPKVFGEAGPREGSLAGLEAERREGVDRARELGLELARRWAWGWA